MFYCKQFAYSEVSTKKIIFFKIVNFSIDTHILDYALHLFYRQHGEKLKMISNRKFGPGSLTFTAYESIKVIYIYLFILIIISHN